MAVEHLFIVEDDKKTLDQLTGMLERLGYGVISSTSREASQKIEAGKPRLVVMDAQVLETQEGMDVAEQVVGELDIPLVYLTASADEATMDRAKGTLPAGFILQPLDERNVKTTVDLALYRHNMDRVMRQIDAWHGGILENLSVGVMAIDTQGKITYMNRLAETITGQFSDKVFGKQLNKVFLSKNGSPSHAPSHLFIEKGGRRVTIDCKESIIRDLDGNVRGAALVLNESNS